MILDVCPFDGCSETFDADARVFLSTCKVDTICDGGCFAEEPSYDGFRLVDHQTNDHLRTASRGGTE